jgi:hypothetical protein
MTKAPVKLIKVPVPPHESFGVESTFSIKGDETRKIIEWYLSLFGIESPTITFTADNYGQIHSTKVTYKSKINLPTVIAEPITPGLDSDKLPEIEII